MPILAGKTRKEILLKTEVKSIAATEALPENGNCLIDQFGRVFNYLRIAVNEKCNLRCIYCMPEEGIDFRPEKKLLTAEEILRVVKISADLGVRKIRFTGGEPLLRSDMVRIVEKTVEIPGINDVCITTSGLLLRKMASQLSDAGLTSVNISLDTLDAAKFREITRRDGLAQVMEGLETALKLPFNSVKINTVFMRGLNHDELKNFVEITEKYPVAVRFIELMPFDAHQIWKTGKFYGAERIVEELKQLFPELKKVKGSATEHHVFRVSGFKGNVAVIPAYSRTLCGNCNRVRLTADGKLRNCLYSDNEFSLRDMMRNGTSDEAMAHLMKKAMWLKPEDGWVAQRQGDHGRESMTQIGG
ncbi:MAG: GTP 3',8-cyclase MoaA [Candidatus Marinimicrobia bacterium]|nr:GTP 3',8-cyclase MoaA [Candidatus Neomarinimicrobiota bacterium]